MRADLPFTAPALLAPMEGITEPCFRGLVLERNPHRSGPDAVGLGGAFTEFARVSHEPLPLRVLARHLGSATGGPPVGLQLMGADVEAMAETARRAEEAGAPLVDLNFGCPAPGALRGCAGSYLLDRPRELERLVRACADALRGVPLTAKVRAGGDDDRGLEDVARAVEAGGARMLTVHCRTRKEAYADTADWRRLERAVASTSLPVCGNGGISTHADIRRLLRETGCAYAMVGRAALADPWIFRGQGATRAEAVDFLLAYAEGLAQRPGTRPTLVAGRLKQLVRHWRAADLFSGGTTPWLRERDPARLLERLAALAADADAGAPTVASAGS